MVKCYIWVGHFTHLEWWGGRGDGGWAFQEKWEKPALTYMEKPRGDVRNKKMTLDIPMCFPTFRPAQITPRPPPAPANHWWVLLPNAIWRIQQQRLGHPFRVSLHLDMLELHDVTIGCPKLIFQHWTPSSQNKEEKIAKREEGVHVKLF